MRPSRVISENFSSTKVLPRENDRKVPVEDSSGAFDVILMFLTTGKRKPFENFSGIQQNCRQ